MQNKQINCTKYELFLFFIIISQFLFYLIIHPRMTFSDDYVYAKNAFDIFNGTFKLNSHHFYNRFAVFIPVGILYKIFGINDFTTTLWPFLISLFTVLTVYYFVQKNFTKEVGVISAFLVGFNFSQINWSLELAPDVIMCYFVILAIFLLYEAHKNNKKEIIYGLLFVLSLFFAFLSKENIITILPFLLFLFIYDIINKKNIKFWISAILSGTLILIIYFTAYQIVTGDFLYRFKGIESGHNLNDSSYVGNTTLLIKRIIYLPALMFIDNFYYFILLIFSIPIIISFIKNKKNIHSAGNFWALYAILLFICFWFGSTSLKYYNPFNHRQDRTWMMMIVPLSILSAIWLYNFIKETDFKKIIKASIYSIVLLSGAFLICIFSGDKKKALIFGFFILFFVILLLLNNKNNNFRIIAFKYLIFIPFILITIGFSYTNKKFYNYHELKETFNLYLNKNFTDKTLIITYPRLTDYYSYLYKFNPPSNYLFYNWEELDKLKDFKYDKIYILIEENQINLLKNRYGRYTPKFMENIPKNWEKLYDKKKVSLYKINMIEDFKVNY